MRRISVFAVTVFVILFTFSIYPFVTLANRAPTAEYGRYLAKVVDDVVKTIHATEPKSFITHADILAIMCVEQRSLNISNSSAASRAAGAKGLTQVTLSTFATYAKSNRHGFGAFVARTHCTADKLSSDPRCSIEAGARIFDDLLVRFNGDRNMAAGAYNGGPGGVISKTQYKNAEAAKYATQLFPACYNKVRNGRNPAGTQVWQALLSEVSKITNGTFGLHGVAAQLVPYIAGSSQFLKQYLAQTPAQQSFWQRYFGGLFYGSNQQGGSSTMARSSNSAYDPARPGDHIRADTVLRGDKVKSPEVFFTDSEQASGNKRQDQGAEKIDTSTSNGENGKMGLTENSKLTMKCLPSIVEPGEPFIVAYSCPADTTEVKELGIGSSGAKTYLSKKTSTHSQEYSVTCRSSNNVQTMRCKITVAKPQINNFTITPVNPVFGDKVTVTWSTDNVKSCVLSDNTGHIKRSSTSGSVDFVYNDNVHDLRLICSGLTGRVVRKTIQL